jgi:SpoVK/Ycf46/Vps4 family AAA+-type ATPase
LSRSFKVKESSSAAAFIIRFTQFIVERVFQRDKLVLVIVADNPRAMERRFINTVDFTVDIDLPTREERELYLKHLLSPESTVDFSLVTSEMEGWTWGDIEAFAKHAMLQKQARELKDISAKFLLDAMRGDNDLDRFTAPSSRFATRNVNPRSDEPALAVPAQPPAPVTSGIQANYTSLIPQPVDDPFKELLWESAADREYDVVVRVLEHLEKGVFMQEDRACLARYPFLLHDDILTAKRKLDAAKNKIDVIKKHFRGKSA